MKHVIKNINFWFPQKLYEIHKNVRNKIFDLKKIYKFTSDHFLIGYVIFVLIVQKRYQQ